MRPLWLSAAQVSIIVLLFFEAGVVAHFEVFHPLAPRAPVAVKFYEEPWCGCAGWALDDSAPCVTRDYSQAVPLPKAGTCPGAYELWRFSAKKPPICVRRA